MTNLELYDLDQTSYTRYVFDKEHFDVWFIPNLFVLLYKIFM